MTLRPPGWIQASTYSAENDRLAMMPYMNSTGSSVVSQFSGSNGWDGGVGLNYGNTCFKVVQHAAGANMSVDVSTGYGWLPGQSTTTQGMYTVVSDAITNLAIATANVTNPRIDLVYMQLQDAAYSGSNNQFVQAVVTGTPAVSPLVPALPANSIPLARVAVAANATSVVTANITDVRIQLGSSGGLVQAPSGFMPLYAAAGMSLWQPDTGKMKVFSNANAWEDFVKPGAWTTYTPVWTSSGTAPTLGNGTLTGRYSKIGRQVTAQIIWTSQSTTLYGTGTYTWSLPFLSATTVECAAGSFLGTCAGAIITGVTDILNDGLSQKGFCWAQATSGNQVANNSPGTFVSGDTMRMLFTYESAT